MDNKELKKAKRKRRLKIFGRIMLVIAGLVLVLLLIFHRVIIDAAKILHGKNKFDKQGEIEYQEVKLSKEQMLEDFNYLFDVTVNTSLHKDLAEQYYGVDYDEIYETYKERIENCKDEYEFVSILASLHPKLPGGHNFLIPPRDRLMDTFEMAEFFDDETRSVNYALWKQFEDRMAEYNEKGIVAFYYDGDYIFKDEVYGSYETIDDLANTRLVSLNGRPVRDVVKELDEIEPWHYDSVHDQVCPMNLIFNESIGEKYEAVLEREDGSTFTMDLYNSAEYNLAFRYRSSLYKERFPKSDDSSNTSAESTLHYSVEADAERKLVYIRSTECVFEECKQLEADVTKALEEADAETVIIDFRGNTGGDYSYVTSCLLPLVLDHNAGDKYPVVYPNSGYIKKFSDNRYYRALKSLKVGKDKITYTEPFTVKGKAKKHYDVIALVDHHTFSTGDIFANIVKDDGIPVIGQNTGGEGIGGLVLADYLPNSKLQFSFNISRSERRPADSYVGVEPDYVANHDWEVEKKRRALFGDESKEVYGTIENRLKWDPYFQKAMELINE